MEDIIQWIVLIGIALFLIKRFMPVKGIENISVHEAKGRFDNEHVQFIDVRTPGEYNANHRPPFKNMPLSQLSKHSRTLDPTKEVVIVCQSGMRSRKAAQMLKKQGFENISNVKGGMGAWV